MAEYVKVLDHSADRAQAEQESITPTVLYTKNIPGGTLGTNNCLRLSLQLSTCSLVRRSCPDDTEPGEQAMAQIVDFTHEPLEGNVRTSWSHISLDSRSDEVIYQLIRPADQLYGGDMYRHNGPNRMTLTQEAFVASVNFRCGIADKPAVATGPGLMWYMDDGLWVEVIANSYPPGVPGGAGTFTIRGNELYWSLGFGNIGGGGDVWIAKYNLTDDPMDYIDYWNRTPGTYGWCTAIHAPVGSNYLYAMMFNESLAIDQIVKFDPSTMTIVDTFTLPVNAYHEAMYVVSDDLIYYTSQISTAAPLQIWYWGGGSGGSAHLVDDSVANFGGWVVYGYYQVYPSYKNMFVKTVKGGQYIYLGGEGNNGNRVSIVKLGPIFCPE